MAELMRRKERAQLDLDAARNAGDEDAFIYLSKRVAILEEQIDQRSGRSR